MIKNIRSATGLSNITVPIIDTSSNSSNYFRLFNIPDKFYVGRNGFNIQGNLDTLVKDSMIYIDIIDSTGKVIFHEIYDFLSADKSRLISVYIYDDTPPGECMIYVAGRAKINPTTGQSYPYSMNPGSPDYLDNPNLLWSKKILVVPNKENTQDLVFKAVPKVTAEERILSYYEFSSDPQTRKLNISGSWDVSTTTTYQNYTKGSDSKFAPDIGTVGDINTYDPDITDSTKYTSKQEVYSYYSNNIARLTDTQSNFTPDHVGGVITLRNLANTPELSKLVNDGVITSVPDFSASIVSVEDANTIQISPSFQFIYNTSAGKQVVRSITNVSNVTASYFSNASSSLISQESQSYVKLDFDKLEPVVGDVDYVDISYKPFGSIGDFQDLGKHTLSPQEYLLSQDELVFDKFSLKLKPIGEFLTKTDFTNYWDLTNGDYSSTVSTDTKFIKSGVKLQRGVSQGTSIGYDYKISPKSSYGISATEETEFELSFDLNSRVGNGTVSAYISGSGIISDEIDSRNVDSVITDRSLGELVGVVTNSSTASTTTHKFYFRVIDSNIIYPIILFKDIDSINIRNISVKPRNVPGYSPNQARIILPLSTFDIQTELVFRFNYHTATGLKSDTSTKLYGVYFKGTGLRPSVLNNSLPSSSIYTDLSSSFLDASGSFSDRITSLEVSGGGGTGNWDDITGKPDGLLSGSEQIADDISGSWLGWSASLSDRLDTDEGNIDDNSNRLDTLEGKTLISSSAQIASDISGAAFVSATNEFQELTLTKGSGETTVLDLSPRTVLELVKNKEPQTLPKGTPVYVSGSTGNAAHVYAASASRADRMPAAYVLNEELEYDQEGYGIVIGFINGVNTSAFNEGDNVYVGINGGYTNVKPTGNSNRIQKLGNVIKVHSTNGSGVITGAGRSNDVPNIQRGYIWVGGTDDVSYQLPTSSLLLKYDDYIDSTDNRLGSLETFTGSADTRFDGLDAYTGSADTRFAGLDAYTGSADTRLDSLEIFTGSADTRLDELEGKTLISGSEQIADDISGSFTDLSGSLSDRLTTDETNITDLQNTKADKSSISGSFTDLSGSLSDRLTTDESNIQTNSNRLDTLEGKTLISGSEQIADDISGSFTDLSGSIATRFDINETDITDLQNTKADKSSISGSFTDLSGSLSDRLTTDETNITDLQNNKADKSAISGSFTDLSGSIATRFDTNETDITDLTNNKADKSAISGSFTDLSGSIATRFDTDEGDIQDNSNRLDTLEGKTLISGSEQIADEISGSSPWETNGSDIYPKSTYKYLGVGTTNPIRPLDVRTDEFLITQFYRTGSGNAAIKIQSSAEKGWYLQEISNGNFGITQVGKSFGKLVIESSSIDENAIYIDSDNNVGIGTNAPDGKIDVVADAGQSAIKATTQAAHDYFFIGENLNGHPVVAVNTGNTNSGKIWLYEDLGNGTATDRVVINADGDSYFTGGKVGIGTETPNAGLHVLAPSTDIGIFEDSYSGTSPAIVLDNLHGGAAAGGRLSFRDAGTERAYVEYQKGTGTTPSLRFGTNGSEQMRITSTGNVGIGTTTVPEKLTVQGNISGSGDAYIGGKVGIGLGKKTPTMPLDVSGSGWFRGNPSGSESVVLKLGTLSTNADVGHIEIKTNDATGDQFIVDGNRYTPTFRFHGSSPAGDTEGVVLRDHYLDGATIDLYSGSLNRNVRIRASGSSYFNAYGDGYVGIGTTSPDTKLHVDGEFKLNSATSSTGRFLKSIDANGLSNWADITMADISDKYWTDGGAYLIPSNNEKVLIDGNGVGTLPSYMIRETNAGRIWHMGVPVANEFQIGYGANVTSNPVMRFDASGNVGIGTTSPDAKLEIQDGYSHTDLSGLSGATGRTALLTTISSDNDLVTWSVSSAGAGVADRFSMYSNDLASAIFRLSYDQNSWLNEGGGNVGIGTSSPDFLIHAEKSSSSGTEGVFPGIRATNTNDSGFSFAEISVESGTADPVIGKMISNLSGGGSATGGLKAAAMGTKSNDPFVLYTNNNDAVVIDVNQKVGIGTTSPNTRAHIDGVLTLEPDYVIASGSTSTTDEGFIQFETNSATDDIHWLWTAATSGNNVNRTWKSGMLLKTNNVYGGHDVRLAIYDQPNSTTNKLVEPDATTDAVMTWQQDGNVGINKLTPSASLHVEGDVLISSPGYFGAPLLKVQREDIDAYFSVNADASDLTMIVSGNGARDFVMGYDYTADGFIIEPGTAYTSTPSLFVDRLSLGVGVGTNNPLNTFHVVGSTRYEGTNNSSHFNYGGSEHAYIRSGINGSVVYIQDSGKGDVQIDDQFIYDESLNRFGFGTLSPSRQFNVYRNTTDVDSQIRIDQAGTGDPVIGFAITGVREWNIGVDNSDGDKFKIASDQDVGTNTALTIDTSRRVGIGTSSPTDKFDVFSSSNNQRLIRISHPTSPTQAAGFLGFNTDGSTDNNVVTLGVQYSSTYYNTINIQRSTRNVGIGTTSPSQKLDVRGRLYLEQSSGYGVNIRAGSANTNDGATILIDDNATMAAGVGGSISFRGYDGSTQRSFAYIKGGKENATSSNFDGYLSFHTRQNAQADHDEAIRITSAGNVGIGTSSPNTKLHVAGDFTIESTLPRLNLTDTTGGQDDYTIRNANGTFDVYNATDARVDFAIDGDGVFSINGPISNKFGETYKDEIRNSGALTAGNWYRVAYNGTTSALDSGATSGTSVANRAGAKFTIEDIESGMHRRVTFYAGAQYGQNEYINVIANSYYGGGGGAITKIRVVSDNTYEGSAIDIYVADSMTANEVRVFMDENYSPDGYALTDFDLITSTTGFNVYEVDITEVAFSIKNDETDDSRSLYFDTSGQLGIGTSSPGAKLEIESTGGDHLRLRYNTAGNFYWDIARESNGRLSFTDGTNGEALTILSGGNVGIGTSSPDEKLEIVAADPILQIRDTDTGLGTANATLRFAETGVSDATDNYWDIGASPLGSNWSFHVGSNGTDRLSIRSDNGFVGIGTSDPQAELHISNGAHTIIRLEDSTSGDSYLNILHDRNTGGNSLVEFNHVSAATTQATRFETNGISVWNYDQTADFSIHNGDTAFFDYSVNRVGINTTSPDFKLDLETGSPATNYTVGGRTFSDAGIRVYSTSDRTAFTVEVANAYSVIGDEASFQHLFPFDSTHNGYVFRASRGTTLTDSYFVDMSGNGYYSGSLGIGTSSPAEKLDIQAGNIRLDNNQYLRFRVAADTVNAGYIGADSANRIKVSSDYAEMRLQTGGSYPISFYIAGSEAARIHSDGNVGIGTNNPAVKFHVKDASPTIRVQSTSAGTAASGQIDFWDSTSEITQIGLLSSSNNDFDIFHTGANSIDFWTDSTHAVRIDASQNVGIGTSSPKTKLDVDGVSTLPYIHKTDFSEEPDEISANAALGGWVAMVNATVNVGFAVPGTDVNEYDPVTGTVNRVVTNGGPDNTQSLSVTAGKIYKSDAAHPIVLHDSGTHYSIAPLAAAGRYFGFYQTRNYPPDIYFYAVDGNITVHIYENKGIDGSPTHTFEVEANTVVEAGAAISPTSLLSSAGWLLIEVKGGNAVVTKRGTGGDYDILYPASRYRFGVTSILKTIFSYGTPSTANSILAYDENEPVVISVIGDGAGGDMETGIPMHSLGDNYIITHDLKGFAISSPYPNTVVKIKYHNGSNWVQPVDNLGSAVTDSYTLNGSIDNPATTSVGDQASGGNTAINTGTGAIWFSANNPFYLRVNDLSSDEYGAQGWLAKYQATAYGTPDTKAAIDISDDGDNIVINKKTSVHKASSYTSAGTAGDTSTGYSIIIPANGSDFRGIGWEDESAGYLRTLIGYYMGTDTIQIGQNTTFHDSLNHDLGSGGYYQWKIGGTGEARLNATGLALGHTNPNVNLHVVNDATGATAGQDVLKLEANYIAGTVGSGARIVFENQIQAEVAGIRAYTFGSAATGLAFETGYNSPSVNMVIDNDGDVGIGTSSPSAKLEVNGNLSVAETNDAVKKTTAFDADFSDGNTKAFSVDGTFNCTVSNMGKGVVCTLILNNGDTLNTSTITVVSGDGGTVKSVGGTDSVTIPASGTGIVSMVRNKNDIIILNIYNSVT